MLAKDGEPNILELVCMSLETTIYCTRCGILIPHHHVVWHQLWGQRLQGSSCAELRQKLMLIVNPLITTSVAHLHIAVHR